MNYLLNIQYIIQIHNEEINDLLNQGQSDDKGLAIRENTSGEIKVKHHAVAPHVSNFSLVYTGQYSTHPCRKEAENAGV